jgi:hypothetical protein
MTQAGTLARAVALAVVMALFAGCRGGDTGDPSTSDVFIAFAPDFAGYNTWTAFDLGADAADGMPATGERRAYLNHLPPTGSPAFPVGTIIVKTIGADTPTPGQTFAMVKRGGVYNVQGAIGWEWFELTTADPVMPYILWRGITPPVGGAYQDCPDIAGGSCNNCHVASSGNDYVPSSELALTQF